MKWRIVLTVLFVVTLFAGFAYLYVNTFVRKHQHAIILFVVNGLDLNTLNMARQQLGRSPLRSDPDDPAIGEARRRAAAGKRLRQAARAHLPGQDSLPERVDAPAPLPRQCLTSR